MFLLRLLDERRADGELVGEVEEIGSGETATLKSTEDLVAFVSRPPEAGMEDDE